MKIEQLDTPFLYLDEDGGGECVAIHPAYLPSHLPGAKQTEALRPHKMEVDELQHALGLDSLVERIRSIEMDGSGCAVFSRPKWTCSDDAFAEQRQAWLRPPLSPPGPRIPAPFSSPLHTRLFAGALQRRGSHCRARRNFAGRVDRATVPVGPLRALLLPP